MHQIDADRPYCLQRGMTIRKKFVIHEHHATRLHFDLRLEVDGVLKSWAVPKGPSMRAGEKRLAVAVPDHSMSYGTFEGTLAEGSYGAGEVRIWDDGKYETKLDPARQLADGKLEFTFFGLKLRGAFVLVRTRGEGQWLLIKSRDHFADPDWELKTVLEPKQKRSRSATAPASAKVSSAVINRLSSRRRAK